MATCKKCNGNGTCTACGGVGEHYVTHPSGDPAKTKTVQCGWCHGSGNCNSCGGSGEVK